MRRLHSAEIPKLAPDHYTSISGCLLTLPEKLIIQMKIFIAAFLIHHYNKFPKFAVTHHKSIVVKTKLL